MSNNNNNCLFSQEEMDRLEPNSLFNPDNHNEPVKCLGMTFDNEDARREHFREELRKKLPELKLIEGFPIGEDDDIINLSDPPYYTACPNPWLNDFIEEWEKEKVVLQKEGKRNPNFEVKASYSSAINERKNDPIYNAHSYHTHVPPEVIMNYYLYYTQPGDIVIDNFAGTGMEGVAANYCAHPTKEHKDVFQERWKKEYSKLPKWGVRNCIMGDLSPIASYITYNYTNRINATEFKKAAFEIYNMLYDELGYLFEFTNETGIRGIINYIVWSEEQVCISCGKNFVYWDVAIDIDNDSQQETYQCPSCGTLINKKKSEKRMIHDFDTVLNQATEKCSFVPVFINYTIGGKRNERLLLEDERRDLGCFQIPNNIYIPISKLENGDKTSDPFRLGIHYLHQFYSNKNITILARFKELIEAYNCNDRLKSYLRIWFTSCQSRLHKMNRYTAKHHRHVGPLANTFYVSSTPTEISPFYFIKSKIAANKLDIISDKNIVNQVCSATTSLIKENSIDYIFTDPPFGANIMYSELNFVWESWLGLKTNNKTEAISNRTQHKSLFDYQEIMTKCFQEYYRILKPGKWITIEFSNTSASVWNSIQLALQTAGFVVSAVTDLNKGRAGLQGIVGVVAVNQDLAISCFKPSNELTLKFEESYDKGKNAMDFIDELLVHLPVHVEKNHSTTAIIERSPKILYDRLISYYVQHAYPIPMDANDFQKELRERYIERDGMFFTATQAAEYEEKKKNAPEFVSLGIIVSDEASGIQWLKNQLRDTSKTYQEIQPEWMQAINGLRKNDILPELKQILEENFIEMEGSKWRLPNIQDDVDKETLRTKSLLREFKKYVEAASKPKAKIKEARVEALRAGFKQCYIEKDFKTIILVGDKIPQNLRDEDEILLQFYDIAVNKM